MRDINLRKALMFMIISYPFLWALALFCSAYHSSIGELLGPFLFWSGHQHLITISLMALPFLISSERKDELRQLSKEAKDYEPVDQSTLTIHQESKKTVYDATIRWLESIEAHFYDNVEPDFILAFHEIREDSMHASGRVEDWEKFFEFYFNNVNDIISVKMEITQGWKKTELDTYEKRGRIWPKFIEEYGTFLTSQNFDVEIQRSYDRSTVVNYWQGRKLRKHLEITLYGFLLVALLFNAFISSVVEVSIGTLILGVVVLTHVIVKSYRESVQIGSRI